MAANQAWSHSNPPVNKIGYPCLNYKKAIEFIDKGYSCLYEVENERHIGLPPKYIGKIDEGIRETLDSDLLKYSEELQGIIVCYQRVQCLETSGSILDETPFMHFTVNVKYVIFRPQVGEKLRGVVNRVGHGHYGCLVHECFNGSVHKPRIDANRYTKKQMKMISNINEGTEFIFRVTRFDVHNDILSIKGKIDDEDIVTIWNIENAVVTDNDDYGTFEIKQEYIESTLIVPESPTKKCKKKKSRRYKESPEVNVERSSLSNSAAQNTISSMNKGWNVTEFNVANIKKEIKEEDERISAPKKLKKKLKRKYSEICKDIKIEPDSGHCEGVFNNNDNIVPKKKKGNAKIDIWNQP